MNDTLITLLEDLVKSHCYEWEVRHSNFPDYLWHYTSIAGVSGILSQGKLWFSDAIFLNDSTELSYAVDITEVVVGSKLLDQKIDPLVKEYLESFLTAIKSDRDNKRLYGFTSPAFVACFCADGDSLHLWRAYTGNGRGYSLGFFPDGISNKIKPLMVNEHIVVSSRHDQPKIRVQSQRYTPSLRRVIYEEQEQRNLIEGLLDSFCQILVNHKNQFVSGNLNNFSKIRFISYLRSVFDQFLVCFKHPSFKDEKEWRFIYSRDCLGNSDSGGLENTEIEYRESGSYLVPYLRVGIADIVNDSQSEAPALGSALLLPFDAIITGPGLEKHLAEASLNSFLLRRGYLGTLISIEHSGVPLRNL